MIEGDNFFQPVSSVYCLILHKEGTYKEESQTIWIELSKQLLIALARKNHQHQHLVCVSSLHPLWFCRKKSKKLQACERQAREKIASFFYQETKSNCATLLWSPTALNENWTCAILFAQHSCCTDFNISDKKKVSTSEIQNQLSWEFLLFVRTFVNQSDFFTIYN